IVLPRALVVALHSADDQPEGDDVELLFELPDQSVLVPLSKWIPIVLPTLPPSSELVLALCNPRAVRIGAPTSPGHAVVHYALGDVTSWLDYPDGLPDGRVRLSARRWCIAGES